MSPREEFRTLQRFIGEIEKQFLTRHLAAGTPALGRSSRQEELDVAAYAVLAHGALENFVEGLGLWVLERLERSWLHNKRASKSSASVLLYKAAPTGEMVPNVKVFDNIRIALSEAKTAAATQIKDNHGISPANLRALFRPLGIDVPEDTPLIASLSSLISLRHRWAHQYRYGVRVVTSARDAKKTVDDCLALAKLLSEEAAAARP